MGDTLGDKDKEKRYKLLIIHILQRPLSGKKGIRTPEALLTLTRFPGGPLQPLEHLSNVADFYQKSAAKVLTFF